MISSLAIITQLYIILSFQTRKSTKHSHTLCVHVFLLFVLNWNILAKWVFSQNKKIFHDVTRCEYVWYDYLVQLQQNKEATKRHKILHDLLLKKCVAVSA